MELGRRRFLGLLGTGFIGFIYPYRVRIKPILCQEYGRSIVYDAQSISVDIDNLYGRALARGIVKKFDTILIEELEQNGTNIISSK